MVRLHRSVWPWMGILWVLVWLCGDTPGWPQTPTGTIYGRVTDPDGQPIGGVLVILTSPATGELRTVTDVDGTYAFHGLPPGTAYRLDFVLQGFQPLTRTPVEVRAGANTRVDVRLSPGATHEIVVRGTAEQIDIKDTKVSTHFEREVLETMPVARDPWMVLALAPGVFVETERLDGGSEVGRLSDFTARGAEWRDNQWHLDGVPITDVAVPGTSPIYYDFDAFEEIQITSGANDVESFTGGVIINLITRRGENRFSMGGRFLWTGDALQSHNTRGLDEATVAGLEADRIQDIKDYGVQAGGAFRTDRIWGWAAYGGLDYDLLVPTVESEADDDMDALLAQPEEETDLSDDRVAFQHDTRHLDHLTLKGNARWGDHLLEILALGSLHHRQGYQAEFERPPETTYDQREWTPLIKVQDEWLARSNWFLSAKISWNLTRNRLMPMGGIDRPARFDYRTGVWRDSYAWEDQTTRSWNVHVQSILYRIHLLGGHHEIKAGLEFRDSEVRLAEGFANGVVWAYWDMDDPAVGGEVWLIREGHTRTYRRHWGMYIQDTITWRRWSATLGLRWDIQQNGLHASSTPAHPLRPDWLPGGRTAARAMPFTWSTLSPRISIGYDLRGDGRTVVKAAFAMYPSALGIDEPLLLSPTGRRELRFRWIGDFNGNGIPDMNEIDFTVPVFWDHALGDPNRSIHAIADDYRSPRTVEWMLGIEHAVHPNWAISINGFYRRAWNYIWTFPYDPEGRYTDADFYNCWVQTGAIPPEWGGWPVYACTVPKPAGVRWENRPAFVTRYLGVDLRIRRRFAHGWQLFGATTLQQNLQFMRDRTAYLDPTNVPQRNRGPYFTTGWETDVMNHMRWMVKLGGTVRLPGRLYLSGILIARDGLLYQSVYRATRPSNGWGSVVDVYTHRLNQKRLPTFWLLNMRLERRFRIGSLGRIDVIIDAFNILNRALATRKFGIANAPDLYDRVTEIISPRIFRLGVRYTF